MIEPIGISKALKRFGGFVRYYDTTESIRQLAALVPQGDCRHIMACCGGGDQALTMLGAGGGKGSLWAVDINPAQLFVLAAKASFIKQNNGMPSFGQLRKAHPERITAFKRNIRLLQQMYLYHKATGKIIAPPAKMAEEYSFFLEGEMVVLSESGPFWKKDPLFISRVRASLGRLRFAQMDVFDSPDYFKQGSLDLIYLSDIFWPEALGYYQAKLARMAGLLRWGGRIITYLDPGYNFRGDGVSPGRMLAQQARQLSLKINMSKANNGYLVLERTKKR